MKTVEECQNFLVNFFTNTPGLVRGIYNPQEGAIALKDALIFMFFGLCGISCGPIFKKKISKSLLKPSFFLEFIFLLKNSTR